MSMIGNNATTVEPIETENIGALAALILSDLPGCDDTTIRLKLGATLREFCRETNACTFNAPMTTGGYGILPMPAAPQGMIIGSVLSVTECEHGYLVPFEVVDAPSQFIRTEYIGDQRPVIVKFSAYPKAGGEDCPVWFVDRYAEAITAGTMHKLLSMTNRPWSDPQRAAQYGAEYLDAIAEASYRSNGSATSGGFNSAIPQGGIFL